MVHFLQRITVFFVTGCVIFSSVCGFALSPQSSVKNLSQQVFSSPELNLYAMLHSDYFNWALSRYYAHVAAIRDVQEAQKKSDFETDAFFLAPFFALKAFDTWQSMLKSQEMSSQDPFYVFEFGAGTGDMALQFLRYAHGRSLQEDQAGSQWKQFFQAVRYVIGERSPKLRKQQQQKLKPYTQSFPGMVRVCENDALDPEQAFAGLDPDVRNKFGVVISNELFDTFPIAKLRYTKLAQGISVEVASLIPTLPAQELLALLSISKAGAQSKYLERLDQTMRALLDEETYQYLRKKDRWIIPQSFLRELPVELNLQHIEMVEVYVPLKELPLDYQQQVLPYVQREAFMYVNDPGFDEGETAVSHIQLDFDKFYQKIKKFLAKGRVISIDYGYAAWDIFIQNRYYPPKSGPRTYSSSVEEDRQPLSYLKAPGSKDMTLDVDASHLASVGLELGFTPEALSMQGQTMGRPETGFFVLEQGLGIETPQRLGAVTYEDFELEDKTWKRATQLFEELAQYHKSLSSNKSLSLDSFAVNVWLELKERILQAVQFLEECGRLEQRHFSSFAFIQTGICFLVQTIKTSFHAEYRSLESKLNDLSKGMTSAQQNLLFQILFEYHHKHHAKNKQLERILEIMVEKDPQLGVRQEQMRRQIEDWDVSDPQSHIQKTVGQATQQELILQEHAQLRREA